MQSEMRCTLIEIKNNLQGINSRVDEAENQISDLEHKESKNTQAKQQDIGDLLEKITKNNFPNLVKEIDMQVKEAQRVPNKMDTKRPTPRHIIVKMPKVKR